MSLHSAMVTAAIFGAALLSTGCADPDAPSEDPTISGEALAGEDTAKEALAGGEGTTECTIVLWCPDSPINCEFVRRCTWTPGYQAVEEPSQQ